MNFLKLSPVEKRLLLGGIASSLIYYGDRVAYEYMPTYPAELKNQLDPHLPPNADIITLVAPPVAFYAVTKVSKSSTTQEKVADLGFGSALYSFPRLVQRIGVYTAWTEGAKARPAARFTAPMAQARYTTSIPQATRVAVTPTVGKYRLTA